MTLRSLMKLIYDLDGLPPDAQKLSCCGVHLNSSMKKIHETLEDFGIPPGATIKVQVMCFGFGGVLTPEDFDEMIDKLRDPASLSIWPVPSDAVAGNATKRPRMEPPKQASVQQAPCRVHDQSRGDEHRFHRQDLAYEQALRCLREDQLDLKDRELRLERTRNEHYQVRLGLLQYPAGAPCDLGRYQIDAGTPSYDLNGYGSSRKLSKLSMEFDGAARSARNDDGFNSDGCTDVRNEEHSNSTQLNSSFMCDYFAPPSGSLVVKQETRTALLKTAKGVLCPASGSSWLIVSQGTAKPTQQLQLTCPSCCKPFASQQGLAGHQRMSKTCVTRASESSKSRRSESSGTDDTTDGERGPSVARKAPIGELRRGAEKRNRTTLEQESRIV